MSPVYSQDQEPTIVSWCLPNLGCEDFTMTMDLDSAGFQEVKKEFRPETSKRPPATSEAEAMFIMMDSDNRGFVTMQV